VHSTRLFADMGDRDWHALLDAQDAVVRSQLSRFRRREVNTSGDGFLAMFDGPQRAIFCATAIRDAVQTLGIEVHTGECEERGAHRLKACQVSGASSPSRLHEERTLENSDANERNTILLGSQSFAFTRP